MAATIVNTICRCYQGISKNVAPSRLKRSELLLYSAGIKIRSVTNAPQSFNPVRCFKRNDRIRNIPVPRNAFPIFKNLSTTEFGVEKDLRDVHNELQAVLLENSGLSTKQREVYINITDKLIKYRLDGSSIKDLEDSAMEVSPSELYSLGSMIFQLQSKVGEEAGAAAVPLFKLAASLGHKDAKYTYGQVLIRGSSGIPADPEEAANLFSELAKEGHPYAQFALAGMYYTGYGIDQSFEKCFTLYQIAAENGIIQSYNGIGKLYLNGQGVDKDEKKAVEYFMKGAESGDPQSSMSLGHCYSHGKGVDVDFEKSFNFHLKAADTGYPSGIYNVGTHYFMGKGVGRDLTRAAEYFQMASDLGFTLADINLGNMYYEGLGVQQNLQKAKELYQRAALTHKHAQTLVEQLEKEETRLEEEKKEGGLLEQ